MLSTTRSVALISRREWRWVAIYTLFMVAITTLPYLLAWVAQGEGWRFTGFLFGVEDGFSYLGKMRLGVRGLWDFYLFYTSEAHNAAPLIFLPYIIPGQIVRLFLDSTDAALPGVLAGVYHLLRIVFDALLIAVLYRFIAAFVRPPKVRLTALVLATMGGGLGWLLPLVGAPPPEFYIPEGFSWLILFGLPHLALARAALLGGLLAMMRAQDGPRSWDMALMAGGLWLVVGLAVPFYFAIVYVILGAWGLAAWVRLRAFPRRLAWTAVLAGAVTLPLFAYYALTFAQNDAFARWSAQNLLESPPPLHYLLAYSLLLLPALVGWRGAWRRASVDLRFALLVGWPLAGLLLVYLPVNVQRRMGEAVIVPLAILAASGVEIVARRGRSSARRLTRLAVVLLAVGSLSSALFWAGSLAAARNVARPLFHPVEELAAFDWLNHHAAPDDVVLASVLTGNALPAYTNQRPFMGHGPETLDWPHKTRLVEQFFGGAMNADERAALIRDYRIRYVIFGPLERALAPDAAAPAWAQGWQTVYDAGGYRIYETAG